METLTFIEWLDEDRRAEEGAALGDPRRCPTHPEVVVGSPCGLYDGLCDKCEAACHEAASEEGEASRTAEHGDEEREHEDRVAELRERGRADDAIPF